MPERLTVSLEDGSVERLRELAGGERKVGAYLSEVVEWLWTWRQVLEIAPLSRFYPRYDEFTEDETDLEAAERTFAEGQRLIQESEERRKEWDRQSAALMKEIDDKYAELERRLQELEAQQKNSQRES